VDYDRSGYIDLPEFMGAMRMLGLAISEEGKDTLLLRPLTWHRPRLTA
jgi:hypothetical protein